MGDEGGKLFVGSLSWGTTDESLQNAFSGFGDVVEARARAGPSRNHCSNRAPGELRPVLAPRARRQASKLAKPKAALRVPAPAREVAPGAGRQLRPPERAAELQGSAAAGLLGARPGPTLQTASAHRRPLTARARLAGRDGP